MGYVARRNENDTVYANRRARNIRLQWDVAMGSHPLTDVADLPRFLRSHYPKQTVRQIVNQRGNILARIRCAADPVKG